MTVGHGSKRPQREEAAIAALLSEPTLEAAATRAGIGESTLLRWLEEPAFQARYRDAKRRVLEHAVSRLQQSAGKAVDVLVGIAEDRTAPHTARVSAARTVLDQAFRGLEVLDLAAEVAELKRRRDEAAGDGA